jgi:anti-anti-sigma factor
MNLRIEAMGEITHVIPEGRLDFDAAPAFQQALERLFSGGGAGRAPAAVIIDGAALEYVSSAGLRAVLLAAKAAQRSGTAFALCALQPAVREVFALSGFSQIMPIHPDLDTALAKLRAPHK